MSIRFHHESKIKEIINEWHTRNRFFSRCLSDLLVISWRWHTFDANRSQCSHISDSVWIFQVWARTENGLTRIKAILDGTASEKCEMADSSFNCGRWEIFKTNFVRNRKLNWIFMNLFWPFRIFPKASHKLWWFTSINHRLWSAKL